MTELTVVMPVYNERETSPRALEALLAAAPAPDYEVPVVDDESHDGTRQALAQRDWPEHVRFLAHDRNRGKGAAIRTALAEARGSFTSTMPISSTRRTASPLW